MKPQTPTEFLKDYPELLKKYREYQTEKKRESRLRKKLEVREVPQKNIKEKIKL